MLKQKLSAQTLGLTSEVSVKRFHEDYTVLSRNEYTPETADFSR